MDRRNLLFFILSVLSLWSSLVLARSQISLPEKDDHGGRVQTYIVHVRKSKSFLLHSAREREDWHKSFLPSLTLDSGEPRLVYSYQHAIGGFAARLTPEEAEAMEHADGVLSVQLDGELKQRTTHSPKFLGLTESGQLWEKSNRGEGMIIGVLEFGFNSTHESFSDFDMPPPPPSWRGKCDLHPENCNNKLIGNRLFNSAGAYNPTDPYTHGTHVASIAAGNMVTGASFRGEACGTASGAAPRAHLAFYSAESRSDWLMAVDTAIEDGVDVLSISIGLSGVHPFYFNPMDIATLAAAKHGIFVSVAAGNQGPYPKSVEDMTPWTLSVGASTMDRETKVQIILGNGDVLDGESIYVKHDFFPVGAPLPAVILEHSSRPGKIIDCEARNFGNVDVSGKAVLCYPGDLWHARADPTPASCKIDDFGGKAMIFMYSGEFGSTILYSFRCKIPMISVNYKDEERLKDYVASDPNPTVSFEPIGTITGVARHPAVASFSGRGPSLINNNMVLKPDILGPGVNILAANGMTRSGFFYQSGTSMAAPHLSGIAAMLRSLHPTWSPAMIKSALMTTADWQDNTGMQIMDEKGDPASFFATGAGQVNATKAANPGLVYDIQYQDYVKYVCGLGYTPSQVEEVLQEQVDCAAIGGISGEDLNYPSFYVKAEFKLKVITRTLMNVGRRTERYTLSLKEPRDVHIDVFPRTLDFLYLRENLTYTMTIISMNPNLSDPVEGQLTWVSPYHEVRSPIVITFD